MIVRKLVLSSLPGGMYRHAFMKAVPHYQLIGQLYAVRSHWVLFLDVNKANYDSCPPYQFPSIVVHTHSIVIVPDIFRMIVRNSLFKMALKLSAGT